MPPGLGADEDHEAPGKHHVGDPREGAPHVPKGKALLCGLPAEDLDEEHQEGDEGEHRKQRGKAQVRRRRPEEDGPRRHPQTPGELVLGAQEGVELPEGDQSHGGSHGDPEPASREEGSQNQEDDERAAHGAKDQLFPKGITEPGHHHTASLFLRSPSGPSRTPRGRNRASRGKKSSIRCRLPGRARSCSSGVPRCCG